MATKDKSRTMYFRGTEGQNSNTGTPMSFFSLRRQRPQGRHLPRASKDSSSSTAHRSTKEPCSSKDSGSNMANRNTEGQEKKPRQRSIFLIKRASE